MNLPEEIDLTRVPPLGELVDNARMAGACRPILTHLETYGSLQELLDNEDVVTVERWIVWYVEHVLHRRWLEVEPFLLSIFSGRVLANYAYAAGGRFPEAEEQIRKDPFAGQFYADFILQGPWPEAEAAILTSPRAAFCYAVNVLKKRWPEAEALLCMYPYYWDLYCEYFPDAAYVKIDLKTERKDS